MSDSDQTDLEYQLMPEEVVTSREEYMGINYVMTNLSVPQNPHRSLGESCSWIFFHFQLDRVMKKREKKICYCNTWFRQIKLANGKVEYLVGLCSTDQIKLLDIKKRLFEKIHETNANITPHCTKMRASLDKTITS